MDMFLMTLRALDFMEIFSMCVFLGILFYAAYRLIDGYFSSLDGRKVVPSPLTGNGDGAFYCKQDPDKDSADVLSRIRSEGF